MEQARFTGEPGIQASVASSTVARLRIRPNVKLIAFLAAGHLTVDLNQGSLPAILPFLKSAHNLSYAAVGSLVLVANLTSSVIQPLFGFLADRRASRWMLPLSVVLSGIGLAFVGVATGYWMLLGLLIVMGMGVAAYHPEGYKTASSVAGERRATALSWFSVGGNIGIALGPPLATILITGHGLTGIFGMLIPTFAVAMLLLIAMPQLFSPGAVPGGATLPTEGRRNMPGAMGLLILVVTIRSWTQLGFTTFIPFYYIDHLKADPHVVGWLLFVFLGAGALGTVIGGPLADRFGARRFMVWGFLIAAPLGAAFLVSGGVWAFIILGILGGVLVSTFVVTVVLGQSYLPGNAGLAAGLIVGFAIGTGGLAVSLLGWLADRYGLPLVLWISALMPLAGFAAALFLPSPEDERSARRGR